MVVRVPLIEPPILMSSNSGKNNKRNDQTFFEVLAKVAIYASTIVPVLSNI